MTLYERLQIYLFGIAIRLTPGCPILGGEVYLKYTKPCNGASKAKAWMKKIGVIACQRLSRHRNAVILKCAEAAKPFLEGVARSRSGGHEAVVRTIAQCGSSGNVAFSMLGKPGCCELTRWPT